MTILETSVFIRSMFEDELNDGSMVETDIDFRHEARTLFAVFSSNKRLSITFDTVTDFADKFDALHKTDFFTSFKPPLKEEYFCQQLNFLLLIDFIISFFKVSNPRFDVTTITTQFIFEFFVNLGEFFNFMNYLDVDKAVADYLKIMITLYALQLDRDVIERHFYNNIEILDNFFANEVMPNLFDEYKQIHIAKLKCKRMNDMYKTALIAYNSNADYSSEEYANVDTLFNLTFENESRPFISVKKKLVVIPNPEPMPVDSDIVSDNDIGTDNDSDYDSDNDSDYDSDNDIYWTPEIITYMNVIEPTDPAYNGHFKKFVCKQYHSLRLQYDALATEVRNLCADIRIKDYAKLLNDELLNDELLYIKIIIGVPVDLTKLKPFSLNKCYSVACKYGQLAVVQQYVDICHGECDIQKAAGSPNRQILAHLKHVSAQFKMLKNQLDKCGDKIYMEPKIQIK